MSLSMITKNVYVSDSGNHRVMKWSTQATCGIIVAGDGRPGKTLNNLNDPQGIVVDKSGLIYVADKLNHRVVCWYQGQKRGNIIAGNNESGTKPNQLYSPVGISFDNQHNLYVVDETSAILLFPIKTDTPL